MRKEKGIKVLNMSALMMDDRHDFNSTYKFGRFSGNVQ